MNPENESRLLKNWRVLKQELRVEDFIHRFVEHGIFSPLQRSEILNVLPNTTNMVRDKFLQAVVAAGDTGYDALCNFLRENTDNRYSRLMDTLEISTVVINHDAMAPDSRPSTAVSTLSNCTVSTRSLPSRDGETGERYIKPHSAKRPRRQDEAGPADAQSIGPPSVIAVAPIAAVLPEINGYPPDVTPRQPVSGDGARHAQPSVVVRHQDMAPQVPPQVVARHQDIAPEVPPQVAPRHQDMAPETSATTSATATASAYLASHIRSNTNITVDMHSLEQELVRIAPTIADLFQKIAKQTSNVPVTEDDIQTVKEENERLRKTNKSLIEKLNSFQQRIIQLQLDNKRLKESSGGERVRKGDLAQKATELQDMERRLEEHKKALEEKEIELNLQLLKLKDIEEENASHKEQIYRLEELQDEGIVERNIQQEQICCLVEGKEKQKDMIETLEEKQKIGEQRLFRLEERMVFLEQSGSNRRTRRGTRVVSPPRSNQWMNGAVERSHNANVKYQYQTQPEIKFNPENRSSKKGWPYM